MEEKEPRYFLYTKKNVVLIYFNGPFAADIEPILDQCLTELKKQHLYDLAVVSLKSVPTMDEAAVRPVRKFLHALRHKPAEVRLCDTNEAIKKVLNDHSLIKPEELRARVIDVLGTDALKYLLK